MRSATIKLLIILIVVVIGAGLYWYLVLRSAPVAEEVVEPTEEATEEGLVAYWNFDDEGTELKDRSGNDFNGVISGATSVEGKLEKALSFDGKDDTIKITDANGATPGEILNIDHGTISMWFKFPKLPSGNFSPILYVGESDDSGPSSNLVVEIGHGSATNTKLYYTVYNETSEPVLCFDSNENLKENTWYHFAVVNSASGNTGYLNGEEMTNRNYNFGDKSDTQFLSSLTLKDLFSFGYGWFGIDRKFHYFEGAIDEVKIFNKALSADEVRTLANT